MRILLRADSGFAREALMAWCEGNRVDDVFGLARNKRLEAEIANEMAWAEEDSRATGKPARRFKDFRWSTRDSWSCRCRVIGKAEWTRDEANPRFIVTSLKRAGVGARELYERIYCARGEAENRIKECQLGLFADRASAATIRANPLRLWFASMADVLLCTLRRIGLAHTQFADATCATLRPMADDRHHGAHLGAPRGRCQASGFPACTEFATYPRGGLNDPETAADILPTNAAARGAGGARLHLDRQHASACHSDGASLRLKILTSLPTMHKGGVRNAG